MRSDNQRNLHLNDLSSIELEDEGPTPCFAVICIMKRGKTMKNGKPCYGSFTRHKNVMVCPVAFLAMHLFCKFHMGQEHFPPNNTPFPDLSERHHWYDLPVFVPDTVQENLSATMSYHRQRQGARQAIHSSSIVTDRATHLMREQGSWLAEKAGVTPSEIERHGTWQGNSVVNNHYLRNIATRVIRGLAGFPIEGGCYHLPRYVDVPETLLQKVFPSIDHWYVESGTLRTWLTPQGTPILCGSRQRPARWGEQPILR